MARLNELTTDWQYRAGRDCDGDRFAVHVCLHGSGRVLAKVYGPAGADEFLYRATFYCAVPAEVLDTNETFDFIDEDAAKRFVEGILAQFDPLAKPKAKTTAAKPVAESVVAMT